MFICVYLLDAVAHGGNHSAYEPARQPRRTAPPQDRAASLRTNIIPKRTMQPAVTLIDAIDSDNNNFLDNNDDLMVLNNSPLLPTDVFFS